MDSQARGAKIEKNFLFSFPFTNFEQIVWMFIIIIVIIIISIKIRNFNEFWKKLERNIKKI